MKKAISETIVILLLASMLMLAFNVRATMSSEPPTIEWSRTYGGISDDVAWSVIQTNDRGYAIVGWTDSFGAGYEDFWLVKTDSVGNMQWNRTYGGASPAMFGERAYSIIQTSDEGYAMVGETSSFGAGSRDFWLVKTDSNGTMQWNKPYGGTNQEEAYSVIQTSDGGYAIAGRTLSFGVVGYENMWLVKTDSNGNMEWSKAYGGAGIEIAYSVIQTSDGGYVIGGETGPWGNVRDIWLVKTDSNGNMQWDKKYGVGAFDASFSMVQTKDGGYAIAGLTAEPVGDEYEDFYLVKTDADGNMEWNKTYGGISRDQAWSVIQTLDGGYMLAGHTYSFGNGAGDFWLVKTDSNGNIQWNETYGGIDTEWAYEVIQTNEGGYAIAGYTRSIGAGASDFWLIKLAKEEILATIDIAPNTLNLLSKGEWITAYIEFPEGYAVNDINVSTVMLNDTVPAELHPTEVGDYDGDDIPDLMVKFDRAEVISYILANVNMTKLIEEKFMTITLTITGELNDGTPFQGSDTTTIMLPTHGKGGIFPI